MAAFSSITPPHVGSNGSHRYPEANHPSSKARDSPSPAHPPRMLQRQSSVKSVKKIVTKKPVQEREDFHILLFASFFLCFNAGMVNVITLSSYFQLASAHVTGLVAKTSILLADQKWDAFYLPATAWLCFLIGATYAGYTITYETFYLGRSYGRHLLLIAGVQAVAIVIDKANFSRMAARHDYIYACAVACGLQNGITSKYSGNAIRTTHLTGATTDLGIALGHVFKGRYEDTWKIKLHFTSIIGFLLGGIGGRIGYHFFQETTLVINVFILGLLGFAHMGYLARMERLPLVEVARARVDIKVHHHHVSHVGAGLDPEEARRHQENYRRWASHENLERIRSASTRHLGATTGLKSLRSSLSFLGNSGTSLPSFHRGLSLPPGRVTTPRGLRPSTPRREHHQHQVSFHNDSRTSSPHPSRYEPTEKRDSSMTIGGLSADDEISLYDEESVEADFAEAEESADVDEFDPIDIAADDSSMEDGSHEEEGYEEEGKAERLPTLQEQRSSLERSN